MTNNEPLYRSSRKLWFHFFGYAFGVFLSYSAFGSLVGLQSSLNIVESVGTKTTAAIYGSAVASAFFLIPLLFRRFGPRICLISSAFAYTLYISANFHTRLYTMVPAAIVVGIGDTLLWTCLPVYNSFFAREYEKLANTANEQTARFSGYFFAIFQSAKAFVNPLCYVLLQAFRQKDQQSNTTLAESDNLVMHCGANDCQDPNLVEENIDNYVPSHAATFILLGSMIFLCGIAATIHICFLPSVDVYTLDDSDSGKKHKKAIVSNLNFAISTFRDMVKHIFKTKQLLLTPIVIYLGLDYALITSELSRSYSACIFGVSWVPVHLTVYGVSAAVCSTLTGKLSQFLSKIYFICFAAVVDGVVYLYYLLWIPDASTQWAVFPAFIFAGGMQGVWGPILVATQADAFTENLDVGSPVWNFWFMLGICLQFAMSPLTCVNTKLIVHLAVMIIGVTGYVALTVILRKEKRSMYCNIQPDNVTRDELKSANDNEDKPTEGIRLLNEVPAFS